MMTLKQVETVEQLAKALSIDSVSNALYRLLQERESLKSRVQDLEKDRARLEWLMRQYGCVNKSAEGWSYHRSGFFKTPREAIDAAMKGNQ